MIIGVPKEIKDGETRAGIMPVGARELVRARHQVLIESGLGFKVGILDKQYVKAKTNINLWRAADLIVKVKEPLPSEYDLLQEGQTIFTYLHLASPANKELVKVLLKKKITAIDYGTMIENSGYMPLQWPMSDIAGRLAVQIGAHYLQADQGGKGVLLSKIKDVPSAKVTIIGAGTVGTAAAEVAVAMSAAIDTDVVVFDISYEKLWQLDKKLGNRIKVSHNTARLTPRLSSRIAKTDLLIGATLIPGAKAQKVVTEEMVKSMKPGSVIVDVSIDQGGCIETSKLMSHSNPVYKQYGVTHYCVPNMPALVGRTSTAALTSATLPFILELANKGVEQAIKENPVLATGVNTYKGCVTHSELAKLL